MNFTKKTMRISSASTFLSFHTFDFYACYASALFRQIFRMENRISFATSRRKQLGVYVYIYI